MATIATDGQGNYVTLDSSGNWVPTAAPDAKQPQGGNRYQDAPPEAPKRGAPIDFANRPAAPSPSQEELGIPLPQTTTTPAAPSPPPPDPMRLGPANRPLDAPSLEFHPFAPPRPGALSRIGQAAEEGAQGVPALPRLPAYLAPTFANQLISGLEGGIRLGSGLFRGGQQAAAEMIEPILPGLGGEIAALPEAFAGSPHPTGIPEPPGPRIAPPTGRFVYETYGERGTPPPSGGPPPFLPPGTLQSVQLNQLMDAIRAVDQKAANKPPFIPPTTSTDVMGIVTPIQQPRIPAQPPPAPAAPPPSAPAASVSPAAPAVPGAAPVAPPPDPAIMSQADMQARARGYFNASDQAAAQGAMLPDTNAAAVRKLFSDAVPTDPELLKIKAGEPAVQAAQNIKTSGPMSYDTAIAIDRNLTDRMKGASGTDAHELSQLQQALRDQMDQVPDLESLRPGRLAWKQSIKQGQIEDIQQGAELKNDQAQADAYV